MKVFKTFIPTILWALFIAVLCGLPGKDIPHVSFLELLNFDKFVHAGMFAVLFAFMSRAFKHSGSYKNHILISFCLCVPYGGILEILQQELFVDRTADIFDVIANTFGCFAGWGYVAIRSARKKAKYRAKNRAYIRSKALSN